MTREHKLALIVGFSLILLVGVLISDHLSRARQAKIVPVGGETQIAEVRPVDPLRSADGDTALQHVQPQNPVTLVQQPGDSAATPPAAGSAPSLTASVPPVTGRPAIGGDAPRGRADWNTAQASGSSNDPLAREVQRMKGYISPDGVIHLPEAAATTTTQTSPLTSPISTDVRMSPVAADVKTYTVQKGDTLLKIAQSNYGAPKLWHELAKYNGISESGLRLGAKIKLPSKEALTGKPDVKTTETAAKPAAPTTPTTTSKPQPGRVTPIPAKPPEIRYATYTVQKGDTLGHISQRMLGTSKRTQDIIDLNKLEDEDTIPIGTVLKMPVKG